MDTGLERLGQSRDMVERAHSLLQQALQHEGETNRKAKLQDALESLAAASRKLQAVERMYLDRLGIPPSYRRIPLSLKESLHRLYWMQLPLGAVGFLGLDYLYKAWHSKSIVSSLGFKLEGQTLLIETPAFLGGMALILIALVVAMLLHEALHMVAALMMGNRPQLRWLDGNPAVGVGSSSLSVSQFLIILLAPLFLMSGVGILLLRWPLTAAFSFFILLINWVASIGDLWTAWRILRIGPQVRITPGGLYAPETPHGGSGSHPRGTNREGSR